MGTQNRVLIVCKLTGCIHNTDRRCQCSTIGIERLPNTELINDDCIARCDSYLELGPEIMKKIKGE